MRYSEGVATDGTVGPPRRVFNSTPEPSIASPSLAPDGRFLAYTERQPGGGVEIFGPGFRPAKDDGKSLVVGERGRVAEEVDELVFLGVRRRSESIDGRANPSRS